MHKGRIVWLGLPWLLSAALTVAVVWLAVELRQMRTENEQVRQEAVEVARERAELQDEVRHARQDAEQARDELMEHIARSLLRPLPPWALPRESIHKNGPG